MKYIEMSKFSEVINKDFEDLVEIVGEFGDESWDDEDLEMLAEKHNLTTKEADELLRVLSSALRHINVASVKAADKGTSEVTNRFAKMDDRHLDDLYSYTWHAISESTRKTMTKWLLRETEAFMRAIM